MHLHSIFYAFASIELPEGGIEAVRHNPGFVGSLEFGAQIGDLGGVQQRQGCAHADGVERWRQSARITGFSLGTL